MRVTSLLQSEHIFMRLRVKSKKQCLREMVRKAAPVVGLEERELLSAILERENLGSTGAGHGVAIPHARLQNIADTFVFFARLDHGIDFDAMDGEAVDLVFLILAPATAGSQHIKILSRILRLLRSGTIRKRLREAESVQDVTEILSEDSSGTEDIARTVQMPARAAR